MSHFKALITTSGIGSRLGDLTRYMNKALIRVGKKPPISYAVERFAPNVPIVVTLGYRGDQVKQYLEIAHPERTFEFVTVDPYEGAGSSLAYSMLSARDHLQCPFVFITSDTVVLSEIAAPTENWIAVSRSDNSSDYSTVTTSQETVVRINPKGAIDYDYVHIGLVGIHDFHSFFQTLDSLYRSNPNDSSLNDCSAINALLEQGVRFGYKAYPDWLDIGNVRALKQARAALSEGFENLDKLDESIYLLEPSSVVKFFHDEQTTSNRVARAKVLAGVTPSLESHSRNFYRYQFVSGDLLSHTANEFMIPDFLSWCLVHLWRPAPLTEDQRLAFPLQCRAFYQAKTLRRAQQFQRELGIRDQEEVVNGIHTPSLTSLLQELDWERLCDGVATGFHGDLHFENVIQRHQPISDAGRYTLLDWRQDFAGLIDYGDIYYDLAKLNHGMIVSHDIIKRGLFEIKISSSEVHCDILRSDRMVCCQKQFHQWIEEHGFNLEKVQLLTALIFLNIAPLHHYPYNTFLFYLGKSQLHLGSLRRAQEGFRAQEAGETSSRFRTRH